jgi:CheY-like chemotaxis protein
VTEPESRQRILLVDDEEDVQILVSRILKDVGFEVELAGDGAEAIERLGQSRPDLMILDLMMPRVDGWGVLAHMRGMPDPPPVVILTARGEYATFTRGIREGAAAYVFKPFRFQELVATCQRVMLSGARSHRPTITERRRFRRQVVLAAVDVLGRDGQRLQVGHLANLSRGGAQVELENPFDPGVTVHLALQIPGAIVPNALPGRVVWRQPNGRSFSHGLMFVDLSDEDQRHLADLLPAEA